MKKCEAMRPNTRCANEAEYQVRRTDYQQERIIHYCAYHAGEFEPLKNFSVKQITKAE